METISFGLLTLGGKGLHLGLIVSFLTKCKEDCSLDLESLHSILKEGVNKGESDLKGPRAPPGFPSPFALRSFISPPFRRRD